MAQKSPKIDDVKRPEKVTPATSGRPLVVTNRPILSSDPMVVPADQPEAPKSPEPITRTAKTIEPVSGDVGPTDAGKSPAANLPTAPESPEPANGKEAKETSEQPVAVITQPTQPGPVSDTRPSAPADESAQTPLPGAAEEEPKRDAEAEALAEEAAVLEAKTAREQELEQLIASGKYYAPINAVQRKRSRIYTVLLCVLALILAAVLLDAVLDAGLVQTSVKIPHTHFFSNTQ